MIARNWGATFYKEDDLERKSCALGDTFIDAMNGTIEVRLPRGRTIITVRMLGYNACRNVLGHGPV